MTRAARYDGTWRSAAGETWTLAWNAGRRMYHLKAWEHDQHRDGRPLGAPIVGWIRAHECARMLRTFARASEPVAGTVVLPGDARALAGRVQAMWGGPAPVVHAELPAHVRLRRGEA